MLMLAASTSSWNTDSSRGEVVVVVSSSQCGSSSFLSSNLQAWSFKSSRTPSTMEVLGFEVCWQRSKVELWLKNSRNEVVGLLVMMVSWFYKDLTSDTRRVPRREAKKMLRDTRRNSGFKPPRRMSRTATGPSVGPSRTAMGLEEPNKPSLMGLIRSSSFSSSRTTVWPCLNFQVQCVSVS
ncbi:hypothetical protein E3N88_15721 [Mikania micrantha]|uniref:Uncharacterized protein n=1 Tax=Mikania micrantha TaxID=192012 RepID=A0A5N6NY13_9ASTR|nr:hypothetical protein E3N88_15721 [Mikania micrantha]